MTALDTDVAIETPEHIVFRHRVAGPARRFFAYLLDLMLCYGALILLGIIVIIAAVGGGALTGTMEDAAGFGIGFLLVVLFAVQWVYFVVLEGWRGTTPGKSVLGLRVVSVSGRPIGFRAAALRNILRAADALPVPKLGGLISFAGLASMALSPRFQRLGDLVAGTMVIIPESVRPTEPLYLRPPAQPHELAALPDRVELDADERIAIEMFLRRRMSLGRAREFELANMIAKPLSERFRFRADDPSRTLALLYDRAANAGRAESPPSSREVPRWR